MTAANDRADNDGADSDRADNDGPVNDGPVNDGPVNDGAADETVAAVTDSDSDAVGVADDAVAPTLDDTEDAIPAAAADGDPDVATDPSSLLEREGDVAADYLEVLLDIADLDGDIDIDVEADRAAVSIVGEGLNRLIGPQGATLEALQELSRLAVLRETGVRSRLMLDVGGHRARRRTELAEIGRGAAERVASSGDAEKLAPMTPFERKVVHDAVADVEGVVSESEGEEPERRVVVRPA